MPRKDERINRGWGKGEEKENYFEHVATLALSKEKKNNFHK